jgi:hypothetical protein
VIGNHVRRTDLAAAFKLADVSTITVVADGTVESIDAAVKTVIQNYPFLSDEPTGEPTRTTHVPDGPLEGGSPTNRRKAPVVAPSPTLRKKFPALDRMR